MTVPSTFNLDSIVDITVEVSPLAAPRATFNELLIVGTTVGIIDTTERVRLYEEADDMLEDGYVDTDPEYVAAQIYFGQSPAPRRLWIGYQDIASSPAETCLEAITACREENYDWYYGVCLAADSDDHKAIALWVQSVTPSSFYLYTTSDADVLEGETSPANIAQYLKDLSYDRVVGQYSTTQSDVYPNNIYAIIAAAGYACGQNTGLANSAFTMKFKEEVGISTESITSTQKTNITGQNCNVYLSYGNYYNWLIEGKCANGYFWDETVNLDMLVNNIQLSIADLLTANPKIPQTEGGVNQLIHAINVACEQAVSVGFLAPGTWTGINLLNLETGDSLPKGYLVQAGSLADQSDADRQARKSPPLYVAIKEAGAMHSIAIGVYVNR
jgi:hypothetical protein